MKKVGIVYLITESPEARGVLDEPSETRRKTYCEEKSLSISETYQARASGFNPVIRLSLPHEFEYKDETLCEYKGERFKILRDYSDDKTDGTEITLERIRGNAAKPVPAQPDPTPPDPTPPDPTPQEEQPTEEGEDSGGNSDDNV